MGTSGSAHIGTAILLRTWPLACRGAALETRAAVQANDAEAEKASGKAHLGSMLTFFSLERQASA